MAWNYLEPHQARQAAPTPYETKLAGALEEIFGRTVHDLPGVLAELNAAGSTGPDGRAWSEESFTTEMARLGA
jgi:hypothetical protein